MEEYMRLFWCYYRDYVEEYRRLCIWEKNIKMDLKGIGYISHRISSQLCYFTMETIWKNT